jgi:hypothetical protein
MVLPGSLGSGAMLIRRIFGMPEIKRIKKLA